jgi:hypothetical protein
MSLGIWLLVQWFHGIGIWVICEWPRTRVSFLVLAGWYNGTWFKAFSGQVSSVRLLARRLMVGALVNMMGGQGMCLFGILSSTVTVVAFVTVKPRCGKAVKDLSPLSVFGFWSNGTHPKALITGGDRESVSLVRLVVDSFLALRPRSSDLGMSSFGLARGTTVLLEAYVSWAASTVSWYYTASRARPILFSLQILRVSRVVKKIS